MDCVSINKIAQHTVRHAVSCCAGCRLYYLLQQKIDIKIRYVYHSSQCPRNQPESAGVCLFACLLICLLGCVHLGSGGYCWA